MPRSDEEILAQLRKRVELKDPEALRNHGNALWHGQLGLPVDQAKCIELLRESADLGCPAAQYQLGNFYHDGEMGLEQNEEEALKYWEKAAEGGDLMHGTILGAQRREMAIMLLQCVTGDWLHQGGTGCPWTV